MSNKWSRKKKRQAKADRPFRFPKRLLYFCDCSAKFDSADALERHARDCEFVPAEMKGYAFRESLIVVAEAIAFVMERPSQCNDLSWLSGL
jgi:hypothetical protein